MMRLAIVLSIVLVWAAPGLQVDGRLDSARERARVLAAADRYLKEQPITVTASSSPRSAGGPHDFFSEGDYWWPDPEHPGRALHPEGRDEQSRQLRRSPPRADAVVGADAGAGGGLHADQGQEVRDAGRAARARLVRVAHDPDDAGLRYAQAIHGRFTGRGTGIIDTIHLVEVARALERLDGAPGWSRDEATEVRRWFADYLDWLTTDQYGHDERDTTNNHATCWVMQVAAFAHYTGNEPLMRDCRTRFKTVLVQQMAADGSFPRELARTKPYGYSLFNLEAMATICQILSTPEDDLWTFELPDGRGMRRAMAFMVPYIRDKKSWPKPPDVMYDANWPMRQASLLFAGVALKRPDYIDLWSSLPADSDVEEVIRNFFVRQPTLWFE